MKKCNEDCAVTKQVGGDDVRQHGVSKKCDREHPHRNTGPGAGWKEVGQKSKQGAENRPPMPKQDRNPGKHPHQGK
jgi:hypothetical protein